MIPVPSLAQPGPDARRLFAVGIFHRRWPGVLGQMITGRHPIDQFFDPVMGKAAGIKNVIRIAG